MFEKSDRCHKCGKKAVIYEMDPITHKFRDSASGTVDTRRNKSTS